MLASLVLTVALTAFACAIPTQHPAPAVLRRAPGQVITRCTVPNTVALTFDDGPSVYLEDVDKALKAAGAVGTFFFNGQNYGCIYDPDGARRVKFAYDQGHQVASHTWSHAHLTTLNQDQIRREFQLVDEALIKITGANPAFMRPPYGEYNDDVVQVARERGQAVTIWDFDSRDSVGASAAESNQLYDDAAAQHPSTILALNHDVYEQTAHVVVPHAISKLQGAGYRLVTLAECLGMQPYQSVGTPSARDASWTCNV